jgi:hypothetical protein
MLKTDVSPVPKTVAGKGTSFVLHKPILPGLMFEII